MPPRSRLGIHALGILRRATMAGAGAAWLLARPAWADTFDVSVPVHRGAGPGLPLTGVGLAVLALAGLTLLVVGTVAVWLARTPSE